MSLFLKNYYVYYGNVWSWMTFDAFIFLKAVFSKYFSSAKGFLNKFNRNRGLFSFLFTGNQLNLNNSYTVLLNPRSMVQLNEKLVFLNYVDLIFDNFYSSLNNVVFYFNFLRFDRNLFASNIYLNRYLLLNYWHYNYNYFFNTQNRRWLRAAVKRREGLFIGFKVHCVGRFSRKDRVSTIWVRHMKSSLNTLSASVDYAYFSVPLRNSAATVKIWLYTTGKVHNPFFKIF